jgi:hypothetical protein
MTREIFLFFLQNVFGQSYYLDKSNGKPVVKITGTPTWLKHLPQGWFDQSVGFARNGKYEGLMRNYSQQFNFYGDTAKLLRTLIYANNGVTSPIQLVVNKYNASNGIYEGYYKGELNIQRQEDDAMGGVKVGLLEGGLSKLIKTYENTVIEIPCSDKNSDAFLVQMEGYLFHAIFSYAFVPTIAATNAFAVSIVFLHQQGNDVGVLKGDQKYEDYSPSNRSSYIINSNNYLWQATQDATINVSQTFGSANITASGSATHGNLFLITSAGLKVDIINGAISPGSITIPPGLSIFVGAGEKLFILFEGSGLSNLAFSGNFQFDFNSSFQDTYCYFIKPYDVLKYMLRTICQLAKTPNYSYNYQLESNLLNSFSHLALTCGMALRQEENAVIKTSLSEFFDSYNAILSASLGIKTDRKGNDVLFFESLNDVYNSSDAPVNIGEVTELKTIFNPELIPESIEVGYEEKKYDEKQGNQEFNTTSKFKAPHTAFTNEKKSVKWVSKYRADMFGEEYARYLVSTSNTANNSSDNDVFIANIDYNKLGAEYVTIESSTKFPIRANSNDKILSQPDLDIITGPSFKSNFKCITNISPNDTIQYIGSSDQIITLNYSIVFVYNNTNKNVFNKNPLGANMAFTLLVDNKTYLTPITMFCPTGHPVQVNFNVPNLILSSANQTRITVLIDVDSQNQSLPLYYWLIVDAQASAKVSFLVPNAQTVYSLRKETYTAISGLLNAGTAYNIEDLTPKRMLKRHSGEIKGWFFNYLSGDLHFQSSDKNNQLSTKDSNGITVIENADERINDLPGAPLYYPIEFEFKTQIPATFNQIFNKVKNALIKFTYLGQELYGFPIEVKCKPSLNEAQQWKLRCSPLTDITALSNLDYSGINKIELMANGAYIPYLSPVKFIPYDFTKADKYNMYHQDQATLEKQTERYLYPVNYAQKWQKNDIISLQVITRTISPVSAIVQDIDGNQVATITFNQKTSPVVILPDLIYEASYSLAGLSEGFYTILITVGTTPATVQFISEVIEVREIHSNTLLLEYLNSDNKLSTIFDTGFSPSFRVEAMLWDFKTDAHFTSYEDQTADINVINGIPYDTFELIIGWKSKGIPPYIIKLLEYIMTCETILVDGEGFTRDNDAKFEETKIEGWAMKLWKIKVRKAVNKYGISQTTDGLINKGLTIGYNIDTTNFGDGNLDNTITITQLN